MVIITILTILFLLPIIIINLQPQPIQLLHFHRIIPITITTTTKGILFPP
jgi:hypothetical protein